jgi:hypothetical protein
VRDGAESMQEDDPSQHGQHVTGDQKQEEPGISDVQVVGSCLSCWKVSLVGRQRFRRSIVDRQHVDAPRWLACGWLRSGRRAKYLDWGDDLFVVSAQKRAISDSGSALSDGGAKISPLACPRPEQTFNCPWSGGGGWLSTGA